MLEFLKRQLAKLLEERKALAGEAEAIIAAAETEKRDGLNADEQSAFDGKLTAIKAKDAEIDEMRSRVNDATEAEARKAAADAIRAQAVPAEERTAERPGGVEAVREPATYQRGDYRQSWVRDMFSVATNGANADEARQRLARNTREVIEARALSTAAGAGGEFAPPAWLINQYVQLARAARPTADRVQNQVLPMGISSVNIPKLLTGTATAQQSNQNTTVQNTDATTGSVTANIVTIAGGQTISQQELDQSGVNIDDIILQDLALDYAAKVDLLVLNNNATNAKGLLQQTGTTPIAYTSGTPTTKLLFGNIAAAIAAVQGTRYLAPDTIIMHPRRWAAFVAAADTAGRPLMSVTAATSSQPGSVDRNYAAQGIVGNLAGLDVITDPQIPTNLGTGTNQDVVIVMRAADAILWEGDLRSEAFRETKADQLSVYLRVYNYAAFTAARYPGATAVISGTGLTPPAYDGS